VDIAFYTNTNGQDVTHASYSARRVFKKCEREFELTYIQGWGQREDRAATLFGKCIEAAIQYHEGCDRKPGTCVEKFAELWEQVKTVPHFEKLSYTAAEGDYAQLTVAGRDLSRLYEIMAPRLPISTHPKALFQQTWRKEIFPGTAYSGLDNKAIIDCLSFPKWDHPMLPKGEHDGREFVELIIDIKTAGADLATNLVGLDPQLGEYGWQGRIPLVAFLWLVKKSPELKKGSRVTLHEDIGGNGDRFDMMVLFALDGKATLGDTALYDQYDKEQRDVKGKALDAMKYRYTTYDTVVNCLPAQITKQRLQFAAARLSEQDLIDIGRTVAQTTVEQVRAHNEKFYPRNPGIRFPDQRCNFCAMRFICLNDPAGRDANLTQRGSEWLEGVEETD